MSIFGIVVESERDAGVYSALIPRIRSDVTQVLRMPCGDVVQVRRRFVGWLKHFEWHSGYQVDKAFVIRDSDRSAPEDAEAELACILEGHGFRPTFPVHFYATKCIVETLLLADERAVSAVARQRGKDRSVQPIDQSLEDLTDAKPLFRRMLSQASLPDDPKVYEEIASVASLDRIRERCPYFQEFDKRVHAC